MKANPAGNLGILHFPHQAARGAVLRQPPAGQLRVSLDRQQGGGHRQSPIRGGGHRLPPRMAVKRPQHLPAPLPGPLLRQKLLPRIDGESAQAFLGRHPHVSAGPEADHTPAGAEQQGTGLFRRGGLDHPLADGQRLPTEKNVLWPVLRHPCILELYF